MLAAAEETGAGFELVDAADVLATVEVAATDEVCAGFDVLVWAGFDVTTAELVTVGFA